VSWSCKGCANYRCRLNPPYESCKKIKLCELIDVSLLEYYPGRPLSFYKEIYQIQQADHAAATNWISTQSEIKTPVEFLALLKNVHGKIFSNALPEIAGRFRVAGEIIRFGGEGQNKMIGADPNNIECELHRLFNSYLKDRLDSRYKSRYSVTNWGARFLEKFFRIHPFVDGNGRVARLILAWFTEKTGSDWIFDFERESRLSRKVSQKYTGALEYAHKHCRDITSNYENENRQYGVDPFCHLAKWLEGYLRPRSEKSEFEAEPPDWIRKNSS
jgi:fido (protein-threonine AMPylation protein)